SSRARFGAGRGSRGRSADLAALFFRGGWGRPKLERDRAADFFRGRWCRHKLERDRAADFLEIGPSQPLLPVFLQLSPGLFKGRGNARNSHNARRRPLHPVYGPKPLGIRFVRSIPLVNAPDLQLATHHEMIGFPTHGSAGGVWIKRERHVETWRWMDDGFPLINSRKQARMKCRIGSPSIIQEG